ncbi:hypothetical protein RND71_030603 [Anisodus tanguticus]|uniref:Uncharacterized protein n=1 Tax=Anisodus tanguticus TaxID=243964 RepID=A0AAE1RFJ0_9SOLA|nr:hypothetical protein RND71_030603 [Anisodus tanguticus]
MTREYVDWCSTHQIYLSNISPDIVLKNSRQDHTSMSSKGGLNQLKEKLHSSSKFEISATAPKVTNNTSKKKEPPNSLDNGVKEISSLVPPRNEKSHPPIPPTNVGNANAASSLTESNTSEDQYWNSLKKKLKESDDHRHEFADLDTISIGSNICLNGDPNSTITLAEMGLTELCGDELGDNMIVDHTTSLDDLDMTAKSSRFPLTKESFAGINSP